MQKAVVKKVVFIFRHYASLPDYPGGTEGRRIFNTAKLMADNGHEVFLFISNYNHISKVYTKTIDEYYQIEKIDSINIVWINNRPRYYKNDWRRLIGMLDYSVKAFWAASELGKKGIKPDLNIGSVAHIFAVLSSYFSSKKHNCTFWMEVADLWPEAFIISGMLSRYHPICLLICLISRYLYSRSSRVIVLTEKTMRYLVGIGVDPDKIIVFPQGYLPGEIGPIEKESSANDVFTVKYAGSFNDLYPLDELIGAIHILQESDIEVRAELVGGGTGRKRLIELVDDLKLDKIKIYGPVEAEELGEIYKHADVLIVVEKKVEFGFPNKVIDYSMSAKPVILASESDYDLPEDLYIKTKPKAGPIARAIKEFYSMEKDEREKIGKEIYNYAIEKFNMEKSYSELIEPLVSSVDSGGGVG